MTSNWKKYKNKSHTTPKILKLMTKKLTLRINLINQFQTLETQNSFKLKRKDMMKRKFPINQNLIFKVNKLRQILKFLSKKINKT